MSPSPLQLPLFEYKLGHLREPVQEMFAHLFHQFLQIRIDRFTHPDYIGRRQLKAVEAVLVLLRQLPGEAVPDPDGAVPVVSGASCVSSPVEHL